MEDQNQDIYEEMREWICSRQYEDAQLDLWQYGAAAPLEVEEAHQAGQLPRASSTVRRQLQTALLFLGTFAKLLWNSSANCSHEEAGI